MKLIAICLSALLLTGCCCNQKADVSLKPRPVEPATKPGKEIKSIKYPNNFIACRANDATRVKSIVDTVKASGKDVVIYFHGGLSSQNYVVNELGPKLIESLFENDMSKDKLYPIFFNYDADPLDDWATFFSDSNGVISSILYKKIVDSISKKLGVDLKNKNGVIVTSQNFRLEAANLIDSFSQNKSLTRLTEEQIEKNKEYYINILKAETLPEEFSLGQKNNLSGLDRVSGYLYELGKEYKDNSNRKDLLDIKSIDESVYALRVLRILARYVLGSDHGFLATIQEEVLDVLKVSDLGKWHWDKVKRHSKECFADKSNGKEIVDALISEGININTLSHSAGAITTSELISYLAESSKVAAINNVIMLVPAVNQRVFNEHVIKNKDVFKNIYVYSLTEEFELRDDVWSKFLYSSSLLYAVSSLAEDYITLDKMLLIDQHLDKKRRPYNYSSYLYLACEKPSPIWEYFSNDSSLVYRKYPFEFTPNKIEAATHENTKHPWVSKDLANDYLSKLLGINGLSVSFEKVKIKSVESQWLNK